VNAASQVMQVDERNASPRDMTFGDRQVPVIHCDESAFSRFSSACGCTGFVALGLAIENAEGLGGIYVALTPAAAREYAAILTEIADEIDQGKGKQ
jgi:hypothetical protein